MAQHIIHCGLWVGTLLVLWLTGSCGLMPLRRKKCAGWCPLTHFSAIVKLKDFKHWGLSVFPPFSAPGMFLQPRISPCSSLLERTPRAIPSPVVFSWKHSSGIPVYGRVCRGLGLTFRSKGQEGQLRSSFGDREPECRWAPHHWWMSK